MLNKLKEPHTTRYVLLSLNLLLILPFSLPWRLPPYSDFYQDIALIVPICLLAIVVAQKKWFYFPVSRPVIYLIGLFIYWFLQAQLIDLPYPSQNIRTGLFFIAVASLAWCVQVLIVQLGRDRVYTWVMWGVVIAAVFQGVVVLLQYAGVTKYVSWIIFDSSEVGGQYGHRNMLGHHLMWGILATAALWLQAAIKPWQGIVLLGFLGFVLGMVPSRTIVFYLIVLFGLLLVGGLLSKGRFFRQRTFVLLMGAVLWVFVAQLLTPLIVDYWGHGQQSGLLRFADNMHGGERLSEWHKAWLTFKEFPLWGAGWDTYTYHSLTKHELISTINDYRENNYADHCHNSVLQIMAEMGGVGAFFVFGGLLWVIFPLLKNWQNNKNSVILLLLAVSCCHSLFEYPLWYSYFFAVFMIFIALGQPIINYQKAVSNQLQTVFLSIAILTMGVTLSLLALHQWRVRQAFASKNITVVAAEIEAGYQLGTLFPLLDPHFDLGTLRKFKSTAPATNEQDFAQVKRLALSLPNAHVAEHYGFNLYHQGKIRQSLDWMRKTWRYYPRLVPYSMKVIYTESPTFKQLEQPVYEMCIAYQKTGLYSNISQATCKKPPVQNSH